MRRSAVASALVVTLGLAVLLGWVFDVSLLTRIHPSFVTMKANTALLFIVLGSGLWLARGSRARMSRGLGVVVCLVASATLSQDLLGIELGIDQLFIHDDSTLRHPGRMAPATAVSFLLMGLGLLRRDGRARAIQVAELCVAVSSLVALCGYLYGVRSLYGIAAYASMAPHTAAGFLVACAAYFLARPDEGVMELLTSATGAGRLLRRLLPAIVIAPIVLGWLSRQGELGGLYDWPFGLALVVLSNVVLLTIVTWRIVADLERSERGLHDALKERTRTEEQLRQAQHVARVGTFELDLQTGVNTWMPELEVMYGLPVGAFARTQAAWEELIHPADRAEAVRRVERAFQTDAPVEGEWRVVWPDGGVHWLAGRFQVLRDASGRPLRLTGVNIDITERKRAEQDREALLAEIRDLNKRLEQRVESRTREVVLAKERLDGIISIAADAIISVDAGQRILIFNKGAEEIFGWTEAEILGQPLDVLLPEASREIHRKHVATFAGEPAKSRRMAERGEVFGLRKNGERFPAEAAISKLQQESGPIFTVILRDISARVRIEDERQLFVSLIENSSDFIGIADPSGKPTYLNPAGRRMVGISPEAPVEQIQIQECYPKELRPFVTDVLLKTMIERGRWSGETYFRNFETDEAIPVSDEHFMIRDPSGKRILGMGTVTRDISEARRAAAELRASESKFRTLAETIPQIVWMTRSDGWNTYLNQQWVEYTGLSLEQSHGQGWIIPFHPDDRQRAWDAWREAVRTDGSYSLECRLRRRDGVYRWWLIRGASVHDESGKVMAWFGTCTDVEDIKRTEAALRRARDETEAANDRLRASEERFRLTIDEAPIGMALVALDGRFVRVNRALCEIVGYSPAELTARTFHDITHPDDREADVALAAQLARGEIPRYQLEKRYARRDGTTVDVMVSRSILRDPDGAPLYYIAQIEDVTERKRLEEERARAFKERETLLKEIHHRVKNNLQVLSSLFYLQGQRTEQEPLRTLLDESRARIQSIALIHEKLYQSEQLSSIDFAEYLEDLTSQLMGAMSPMWPRARIRIDAANVLLDIERAIPCALIVNELVSNALKHAFPAGRSGEIRITAAWVEPGLLRLTVSDTGVGFPVDLDFRQTTTLGMQLVCSLTTQLRGTVTLRREGGTHFEIQVPVGPRPSPSHAPTETSAPRPAP